MTVTGELKVISSNDDAFSADHTYSVTLTVSQKIDVFGVTDITPVEVAGASDETTDGADESGSAETSDTETLNPNSTPAATP